MTIKRSTILATILAVSIIAAFLYFAPQILNRFLHLDNYKGEILTQLEKGLKRKVYYEKGDFSLRTGPSFSFSNPVIKEKDGVTDFIHAKKINIKLSLIKLLEGKVVITDLSLESPTITVIRHKSGDFNLTDLLDSGGSGSSASVDDIWLTDATINITDHAAADSGIKVAFSKTELVLENLARGAKSHIKLTGEMQAGGGITPFTIGGSCRLPAKGKPLTGTEFNLKLISRKLIPEYFWPYFSAYVPFNRPGGSLDLDLSIKGTSKNFASAGDISVSSLRLDYPKVFHSVLTPRKVNLNYELNWSPDAVKIRSIGLQVDNLKVNGSCSILDLKTRDPRITAKATTSNFRLEEFRGYIPYGIIVKDTADFIEQHIIGGVFRLDKGSLDGRISQILHMEKGENYNILSILARVEQGLLTYGNSAPSFNSIKGTLEMKGKDFILSGMQAKFGTSPFTLNGRITDYPLTTPCTYPFSMLMHPKQPEIAWLMGQSWGKKLGYNGESSLNLKGSGRTDRYAITGEWDLTKASYRFPEYIDKPAGSPNRANFDGIITGGEMRLNSLRYHLGPMIVAIAANYRFTGEPWFGIDIKTNRFPVDEVYPMIPIASPYKPSGSITASVQGKSSPGRPPLELGWFGTVGMAGGSFKPAPGIKPVTSINGTISFSGKTLETSRLSVRLGNSLIQGKGSLTDISNPVLNLVFSTPLLDPADIGLHSPVQGVRIANLSGNIALKDNTLQIAALSGKVNKTDFALKGVLRDFNTKPAADIFITSRHLNLDDILLLTDLEMKGDKSTVSSPTVKATFNAASVRALDMPFEFVKGSFMLDKRVAEVAPVNCNFAGGRLSTIVRVDFSNPSKPRGIKVSCNLASASASRLMHILGVKQQDLRGDVDIEADISAQGNTPDEIKRTVQGTATLKIKDGLINRFSTLSKAFSILNVSQLLKLKLPDLVTRGMPFTKITGTFGIKDGIMRTSDLYLDSDAVNITCVGSYNIYRDYLDVTLGLKPLQTIDKIISSIPIVGWVLTGKEKTLVTAFFRARGELGNPDVTTVQIKGMAKGTFDIFKRIFQLPAKLFTDTGEVIIGN